MAECFITLLIMAIAIPTCLLVASFVYCLYCVFTGKEIEEEEEG